MVKVIAKLDDGLQFEITETVNMDGKPVIEVGMTTHHTVGGAPVFNEIDTMTRREAEKLGKALLRSVAISRKKHPPRKGWP